MLLTPLHQHYGKQVASMYTHRVFNGVIEELREDGLLYISNVMSDTGYQMHNIKNSDLGIGLGGSFFMNQIQGLCALTILCRHLVYHAIIPSQL